MPDSLHLGSALTSAVCEPLEPRVMLSVACDPAAAPPVAASVVAAPGDLTFGEDSANGNRALTVTDIDGTRVTFKLVGPGAGTLSEGDGATAYGVTFTGTTGESVA